MPPRRQRVHPARCAQRFHAPDDLDLDRARALLTDFPALWQRMTSQERKEIAQSLLRVGTYDAGHVIEWHWYAPFQDLFRK